MEIKSDQTTDARIVSQSHFMGEVWGLHVVDDSRVLTCGDDNRVMLFDTQKKVLAQGAPVSSKKQQDRKNPKADEHSVAATDSDFKPNK